MRPITNAFHETVFDRVPMNIVGMRNKIGVVADLVFPESPLPESEFAFRDLPGCQRCMVDEMPTGARGLSFDP